MQTPEHGDWQLVEVPGGVRAITAGKRAKEQPCGTIWVGKAPLVRSERGCESSALGWDDPERAEKHF